GGDGVYAFGRTMRRYGDLRLVAVPAGAGTERSVVVQDDGPPVGTFPTLHAAVACLEALRDREGAARTLKGLRAYAFDEDDPEGALAHATRALDLARASGDPWCTANALNQLGAVRAWGLGDLAGARALGEEALALARRLDDPCTTAWCASGLARV